MTARVYIGGGDPVAHPPTGDRPLSPLGWAKWATGPCRPLGGRQAPFFARDLVANLKKKIHLGPVALWEATGWIFLKYFKTDIYF